MKKMSVAFLFCLTSTIANAQQQPGFVQVPKPVLCGPAAEILKALADTEINERPVWIGKNEDGRSDHMLFVNPKTGAFTLVQIGKEMGCILGIGFSSQTLFEKI